MKTFSRPMAATAMGLALAMAGCNGASLTNGPPPAASDKAGVRTDLRPPATPDRGEIAAEGSAPGAGGTSLGGTGTSGGNAARGGGLAGGQGDSPNLGKGDDQVRATPPTVTAPAPNSAAGGDKPAGNIKVGTPTSPQ